jgi:hypothetical protein
MAIGFATLEALIEAGTTWQIQADVFSAEPSWRKVCKVSFVRFALRSLMAVRRLILRPSCIR